ncbi:MAG TPA: murein biosynthesis integral membrane protein MurJ [Chloroflexota bacterium]|nr:murein biosynthesis integral membrane protein MurJ [Chloroflexota bacterium]
MTTPSIAEGSNAPGTGNAVPARRLLGATAVIALGNVLSRGLGLVRDAVIAATFGATPGTDAFLVARTMSTIVYDLLVGSVSTAAFVPVFVQRANDERRLWRLVGAIFSLAALAFTVLAVVLGLLAEPIIAVIGQGFPSDAQRQLAATMMQIALVAVILQGLAGVLTSALYARNRFSLPAFATATYNAGIIVGILLLAPSAGVLALAFGLVIGAAAQFLLQAVGLREFFRAYRPRIDLADPDVRKILTLAGTVAAGLVVTIASQLLERTLASHLAVGSITLMEFATRIIQVPLGVVGLAVSFAILPTLSRFSAGPDAEVDSYRDALVFGLKLVLLLMLPIFGVAAALAQPLVAVLFERGAFVSADTARTAVIFLAYSPQLPLTAVDFLLINAFYARQNARTPVLVGVVCVFIYLAVALSTIGSLGAVGLALANAVQNSSHAVILLVLLTRTLPGLRLGAALAPFLLRVVPAAVVAGALAALIAMWLSSFGALLQLLVGALLAAVAYGVLLYALGVPEARRAVSVAQARMRPREP